jgi:pyruvate-formate lyase-activating enzyme
VASSSQHSDDFTPFVANLPAQAQAALERLLGCSDPPVTRWELREGPHLEVVIGDAQAPFLELDIIAVTAETRAWHQGDRVALSYRGGRDGSDPLSDPRRRDALHAIRTRLAACDAEGFESGLLAEAYEAVKLIRLYRPVSDVMYRQMRPREFVLRLGFRCNQNCSFCWQGREWPEPPVAHYYTWLEEAHAAGQRFVHFSGGEPTIHRELPALMRKARDYGMGVYLQTNAVMLGKSAFMAKMKDAGLSGVFVSYHASDESLSDAMTRAPKTHVLTERGIENCLANGVHVTLNCVVERPNYAQLAAQARHMVERFVTPFPKNPMRAMCYSHPHDGPHGAIDHVGLADIGPHLREAIGVLLEAGVDVEAIGTCGFPPCLFRDVPKVFRWFDPSREHAGDIAGRTYGEVCGTCKAKPRCLGVRREYIERFGEAGLTPFSKEPWSVWRNLGDFASNLFNT